MSVARFDPTKAFTREEMAAVRAPSDVMGLLCAAHAWIVIAAAMTLYAIWPNPLTFVAAVILIGSRQLGLAILMHDGAHGVLMKTKALNDPVSQWLCAFPVFTDTIPYRHYHLGHHRLTQQPDDPDLGLSAPFPITKDSFRRKMIRDITGQTGFKQRRAQLRAALGEPHYYLMFWLLPLLTWQQVITRIRNIAEHAVVPDNDDVLRNARTTY